MNQLLKIILLFLPFIANLNAQTIYKTVDEEGRTSYSTSPPESMQQTSSIKIPPAPSEKRVEAAQERHQRNLNAAEIMDDNRTQRNEIAEEENRKKQARQKQLQQDNQTEIYGGNGNYNNTQHYGYPYYPRRKPNKPVVRPPVHRPALRSR